LEKGGKFPHQGITEMGLGIPLSQHNDVDGATEAMLPEGFPASATQSVTVNGALQVPFGKDKTEARGGGLRTQTDQEQDAGSAMP
jgi:hypothetical protein